MSIPQLLSPSSTKISKAADNTRVINIRSQFFLSFLCDNNLAINTRHKTRIATTIQFMVWLSARIVFIGGTLIITKHKLRKILFVPKVAAVTQISIFV